jgi:dTDP-4-dehydrorhamnose 3,5-epimerase
MEKQSSPFPDVWILHPQVFEDQRGFFYESFSIRKFKNAGLDYTFVQDNHSRSVKNTVRGLHFQLYPGQVKLVRCTLGRIWDVVVDIRPDSPTFKQWWGIELSKKNKKQVLIPVGYAHGFSVLSDHAEVQYKVSSFYNPELERGIFWNDPELNIDWKVQSPILSEKDKINPPLEEFIESNPHPFTQS